MKPILPATMPPIPHRTPEERERLGLDPEGTIGCGGADFAERERYQAENRPKPRR
jgi:hypothetical protein